MDARARVILAQDDDQEQRCRKNAFFGVMMARSFSNNAEFGNDDGEGVLEQGGCPGGCWRGCFRETRNAWEDDGEDVLEQGAG